MKLTAETLSDLPSGIVTEIYDRTAVRPGIAHLSVGNFHRAHQAVYTDRVLALPGQEGWGILGIGLVESASEKEKALALQAQSGLYTLTECPAHSSDTIRVVQSIVEYCYAPDDRRGAIQRLADPHIRLVTMTITEGGYYMDETGGFLSDHPDIVQDVARDVPHTAFGLLVEALNARRKAGIAPFTILSCDNVPHNGQVTRNAVLGWAHQRNTELAGWISEHVAFPSCMVDRITPAVRADDVTRLNAASGIDDRAPVYSEDFIQWVVEDKFPQGRPAWEKVGVLFTQDVAPYEQVKLRMLNASHSMLALPAVQMGYRVVNKAMKDPHLTALLEKFLHLDVIPLIEAPPGITLSAYAQQLLSRFSNKAVSDQLVRIASDSASKLPVFVRPTAMDVVKKGEDIRRIAFLLACFCSYISGLDDEGQSYSVQEPRLSNEDKNLILDNDYEKSLQINSFSGWDLDKNNNFIKEFVRLRKDIKNKGVSKTLEKIISN